MLGDPLYCQTTWLAVEPPLDRIPLDNIACMSLGVVYYQHVNLLLPTDHLCWTSLCKQSLLASQEASLNQSFCRQPPEMSDNTLDFLHDAHNDWAHTAYCNLARGSPAADT